MSVTQPSPTRCDSWRDPEESPKRQRLDCRHRPRCLHDAAVEDWRAFTCEGCGAYHQEDPEVRASEVAGLIALGRAMSDQPSTMVGTEAGILAKEKAG